MRPPPLPRLTVISLLLILIGCYSEGWASSPALRVMTYNIRYDNPADSLNGWPYRRDFVASLIRYHRPQILGTQEGLAHQLQDLTDRLPGYQWHGVGRDDGRSAGEHCAIFYDTAAVRFIRGGTFWLSPSWLEPSRGWDAALNRICTWAEFEPIATGRHFFVFNTHFDHQGAEAREQSAHLVGNILVSLAGTHPVVLLGDFNSTVNDRPVQNLIGSPPGEARLVDAMAVSATPHHGPVATFNGFDVRKPLNKERIDFIFVRPGMRVLTHAVLADFTSDLRFPSDHLPVVADILFE